MCVLSSSKGRVFVFLGQPFLFVNLFLEFICVLLTVNCSFRILFSAKCFFSNKRLSWNLSVLRSLLDLFSFLYIVMLVWLFIYGQFSGLTIEIGFEKFVCGLKTTLVQFRFSGNAGTLFNCLRHIPQNERKTIMFSFPAETILNSIARSSCILESTLCYGQRVLW